MTKQRTPYIRCLALALIFKENQLLVARGYDPQSDFEYFRPLGGGIEYGETGEQALIREIQEELQEPIQVQEYCQTLENHFEYKGQQGHEMIRLYLARFLNPEVYERAELTGYEDSGASFQALWVPLPAFSQGKTLVPPALLPLLKQVSS